MGKKAILMSGGMDSIALAYWTKPEIAFTIDYGQIPAETEIRSSTEVAKALKIEHHIIQVDCSSLGSGDLVNRYSQTQSPSSEWWPFRNQMLITFGAMKGIALEVTELILATVKSDSFHKDGTPQFYQNANTLLQYQEGGIRVYAPAINLTTLELVRKSRIPRSILLWAHSCHKSNIACGHCRGCNKYYDVLSKLNSDSDE